MIYDYFRVAGAHNTVWDYADLFCVTLRGDNVQEVDTRWDEVLLSMSKIPSDDILESLLRESDQLKTVLEVCDKKISVPNYQKLKTVLKRSMDQKLRLRNSDARHGRIVTGAVVKNRKGLSGVGQQEELHRAQAEERRRRGQQLLHEQCLKQNWDLRRAHEKSLNEMEEFKKFQTSTFNTIARRSLVRDQDTILELTGKIQELQNEVNFMNDSKDFQDAESIRSGNSHVTSRPVSFPPHEFLKECLTVL